MTDEQAKEIADMLREWANCRFSLPQQFTPVARSA